MNYEEDKHPHRVFTEYSQKTYWKEHTEEGYLCAGNELDCMRVELRGRYCEYPTFMFDMPRQKHELEKIERLMANCYERGKLDRGIAIGKMMKELIEL